MRRLGIALLAVLGCSPVKDNSNVPDASIDAMDTRPPMIASSVPADMGTKASVIEPVVVFLDEPLDAATVSATTVKLTYLPPPSPFYPFSTVIQQIGTGTASGAISVKGTVTYDAGARKIVFEPAIPLVYGAVHVLQLDVKDTAGLALTTSVTFTTFVNAAIKTYSFTGSGLPSSWVGNPTNMDGRWTKRVAGASAGSDAIWFSADDPRNQHTAYNIAPDGRVIEERIYTQGGDAQYDTPDDTISACFTYKYDANKLMTERVYPGGIGPDATWCTSDDVPAYLYGFVYDAGKFAGYVWWTSPGTDNTWRTSDDRCTYYYDNEYDAMGLRTREVLRTCGADSLPRTTADDPVQYYEYQYDANGYVTRQAFRTGTGPDTMWLTADDIYNNVERFERDANGLVGNYFRSTAPGTDGVWGTPDDPSGSRSLTTYNADGLATKTVFYSSYGADAMWGTDDDVISSYVVTTYDDNGNRSDQKTYNAGIDAVWQNADDRVITDVDFDLNR